MSAVMPMLDPVAALWSDPRGEWRPLIPLLRQHLPVLISLGDYNPPQQPRPALLVEDDELVGAAVVAVLISPDGRVIAQRRTGLVATNEQPNRRQSG